MFATSEGQLLGQGFLKRLRGYDTHMLHMSRQFNRIISNCGRSVIKQRLADIEQRFGVAAEEVMAAYSSQTCRRCDYIDERNRSSQSSFRCLFCGHRAHADVNAAGTLLLRRNMTKDGPA